MKKIIFIVPLFFMLLGAHAQIAINTDGSIADSSAMLDVQSTSKGLLIPRMTQAERDAVSTPATGLMIYQTDNTIGFYYYNGTGWTKVGDGGAEAINDLTDGKYDGTSVFLGNSAGSNDDGGNDCVAVGKEALTSNTSGQYNTAIGYQALYTNTTSDGNLAAGHFAMHYNQGGTYNVALGFWALGHNTDGDYNTAVGNSALTKASTGDNNTALGHLAGQYLTSGSNNTFIGYKSGCQLVASGSASGNVFIGYQAGYDETGSNKLYIENSSTSAPLIYGEFDNNLIRINGDLEVTGTFSGSMAINDLSDAKTSGSSLFLGSGAGAADDSIDNKNVAVGVEALNAVTSGTSNVATGYNALYSNIHGDANTAIGNYALYSDTSGHDNTAMGYGAGYRNTAGDYNTLIGRDALLNNQIGSFNTIIGYEAGEGTTIHSQSYCTFLGYHAGYNETGDNKLYIENSTSSTPLIYGEFDNDMVTIYGNLGVGTKLFGNGTRTLSLTNGTIPGSSITDGVMLYAEDVSASSELKVRDEAGNVTTLSPHNFSMTKKSEPMAWSFYSENHATGKKINVDMLKTVRLIEKITGEKLVYIQDIDDDQHSIEAKASTEGIIQQQQEQINRLIKLNEALAKRIEILESK